MSSPDRYDRCGTCGCEHWNHEKERCARCKQCWGFTYSVLTAMREAADREQPPLRDEELT